MFMSRKEMRDTHLLCKAVISTEAGGGACWSQWPPTLSSTLFKVLESDRELELGERIFQKSEESGSVKTTPAGHTCRHP